jgi:hypothetical protein
VSLFGNEEEELYRLRKLLACEFEIRSRDRAERRRRAEPLPPEVACMPVNTPPDTCRRCGCAIVRGDHENHRWTEPAGGSPPSALARIRYFDRHASAELCLVALEVARKSTSPDRAEP